MYLDYEIEYKIGDEYHYLNVEFEAEPRVENDGIGPYEYWGQKCFDKGHNYVSLEYNGDPVWDERLYTDEENEIIKAFQNDKEKWERLCNDFCDAYAERLASYRE